MTLSVAECRLYEPQKLAEIALESDDNLTKTLGEYVLKTSGIEMQVGEVKCAIQEIQETMNEKLKDILWCLEGESSDDVEELFEEIQEKLDETLNYLAALEESY
ncbi:hypothetical protein [Parasutterella muris]|jgi:hypothetical protein|uniref:Uncharacterized protein n=1 Tax=Parasutterella muris TaxID=2565572 RepID=A0A6L6YHG9_9BURK|nr:hypothetical protein [Parasutterella muris]MVX56834.1 hypothetical protein [Parasutterella muris]